MRFPIRLRKPEDPRSDAAFALGASIAETVFKLATCCLLLATVKFFEIKSNGNWYLGGTVFVLQTGLAIYIYGFFLYKFELDIIPREKRRRKWQQAVDPLVNAIIAYILWQLVQFPINNLVKTISELQAVK